MASCSSLTSHDLAAQGSHSASVKAQLVVQGGSEGLFDLALATKRASRGADLSVRSLPALGCPTVGGERDRAGGGRKLKGGRGKGC